MTDFKQLAIDCEEYASACHRSKLWALASHERACRDAIFELMNRVKVVEASAKNTEEIANNWEIFYCEEFGRRKEAETRAEKAEAEVERLRTERVEIMVGDEELTIDELRDRYADIKMRCARLEDALDNVNRAADKLKGLYQTAEKRAEKAETEAKNLRKAHLYMFVDGEELTISQLFDRYTEIKARCDRLEKAREETKAETKRLGDQLIEAVCCREFAVNWLP